MRLFQTTNKWEKWWANRKIDWQKEYLDTWNHPHRDLISAALYRMPYWLSIIEVGCGAGANLVNILKHFGADRELHLGGVDINPEAIELARTAFNNGVFKVGPVDNIMMSDDCTDIVLSDMCLIYYSPRDIGKALQEMKRIGRQYLLLCEFHHESWWERFKLRMTSGYYAYDYRKLLEKEGFGDVELWKIPERYWPGGNPQKTFGYIIKARIPNRK